MNRTLFMLLMAYIGISVYIASIINSIDPPEGNHDETCHFPLATLYCNGIYDEWNPTVTTGPGLYIFTVAPLKLLNLPCTICNLRIFNIFFNSFSFVVLYHIISYYHMEISESKKNLITINLALFPLNYFFSFLYYTDPLSTFLNLLMHFLWIKRCYHWSAVAGFCGVLTRQTTIVWVFFHLLLTAETIVRSRNIHTSICNGFDFPYCLSVTKSLVKEILQKSLGYAVVGLLFVIFIIANNGIVLGDRSNHEVTLNLPQFLYFALFTGICSLPHLISQVPQLTSFLRNHKTLVALVFFMSALTVRYNTVAHHYNLGDGHHFTHYFITSVYLHPYFALSLVPLYTICTIFILHNCLLSLGKLVSAIFLFTVAVNLVFQLLLEMRYYIIAFLLFRLRLRTRKWSNLFTEFLIFVAINVATITLYVMRPRIFPDDKLQLLMY